MTAVEGDGYNEYKSPHSKYERFEGITVGRAALVNCSPTMYFTLIFTPLCTVDFPTVNRISDGLLRSDRAGKIATATGEDRGGSQLHGKVFRARSTTVFHLHPFGLPYSSTW